MFQTRDYRQLILAEAAFGGLPIGYWPLSATQGTAEQNLAALIVSSQRDDGRYAGGYSLGTHFGITQGGVTFNGSTGYIGTGTLGNFLGNLNTTGGTFEAWIRYTSTASRMAICGSFTASTAGGFQFLVNGDQSGNTVARRLTLAVIDTSNTTDLLSVSCAGIANLSDGNWHHVVATVNAGITAMQFYADGVLQTSLFAFQNGTPQGVGNLTVPLAIGARDIGGTRSLFFNGGLAHVAIYPYVMSAARVQAHYLAGIAETPYEVPILWDLPDAEEIFIPQIAGNLLAIRRKAAA